jgi:hypothetical protein
MEEKTLDSGFARRSYYHLTRGRSNLTLSPIAKVLPQNWFKTARPLCMDASMAIYTLFSSNVGHIWCVVVLWWCKTGPIIGHVGTGPNRWFFRLVGYKFNYRICILVLIYLIRFTGCHTCYSASNGRKSPRFGVRTKELWPSHSWGIKSIFIPITVVLPRNWFKTARPLCMDDSMAIYTLFSSNMGHIWGAVKLGWCKTGPIIGHMGTEPNRGFFRPVGH